MSYCTVEQLRDYLKQVKVDATSTALLEDVIDRATSIIDVVLAPLKFADYPASGSLKIVRAYGGHELFVPAHQAGSISSISYFGTELTGWTERDDARLIFRQVANAGGWYSSSNANYSGWPSSWLDITAKWGFGPPPAAVVEVALELAVNIWRAKDRGLFTDVIGVDASGIGNTGVVAGYAGALTNQQKMILTGVKRHYQEVVA